MNESQTDRQTKTEKERERVREREKEKERDKFYVFGYRLTTIGRIAKRNETTSLKPVTDVYVPLSTFQCRYLKATNFQIPTSDL